MLYPNSLEKGGRKLSDRLQCINLRGGINGERQNLLQCDTKLRLEKFTGQSCVKRGCVYKTGCADCEKRDQMKMRRTESQERLLSTRI